ncbi:MAG: BMP family ABC transporter substrate-binding protein [Lachnospiraceae bacterium]|nr:BMP family ABC transporter substrate-binding protein [Lachnospiraceae bacterium]
MKKILSLILCLAMVMALVACGGNTESNNSNNNNNNNNSNTNNEQQTTDKEFKVAMVTDYGDITDQSFNQTTYEACQAFCTENGLGFTYFKPASDSDEDRIASIEQAIDEGYNVIVMPGYAFGPAIKATAGDNPEVTFIALDVSAGDLGDDYVVPSNLYCAVYQEELCGYMAGYAAVKLGYKKLGFLGGMAVPAVVRYGYGFVQGVDAAAAELGLTDVEVKYCYGNQFYGDADITAFMDTWYQAGTEVVFACGGGIFTSAGEAAKKVNAKVIGVDVDQAAIIDGMFETPGMTVTSAMKGLAATVKATLAAVVAGTFAGGKIDTLGLVSDNPEENFVQIAPSTQFGDTFTADDYKALVAAMHAGTITVSNDITKNAADFATVITVVDQGNIK